MLNLPGDGTSPEGIHPAHPRGVSAQLCKIPKLAGVARCHRVGVAGAEGGHDAPDEAERPASVEALQREECDGRNVHSA
eukprot:8958609-Alexandrium_andersonii.AAC.1